MFGILCREDILEMLKASPPLADNLFDIQQQVQPNGIDLTLKELKHYFHCTHVSNRDWVDPTRFDYVLYHIGGSSRHDCAFKALRKRPGPAIIHEHNCLSYYYEAWPNVPDYEQNQLLSLKI